MGDESPLTKLLQPMKDHQMLWVSVTYPNGSGVIAVDSFDPHASLMGLIFPTLIKPPPPDLVCLSLSLSLSSFYPHPPPASILTPNYRLYVFCYLLALSPRHSGSAPLRHPSAQLAASAGILPHSLGVEYRRCSQMARKRTAGRRLASLAPLLLPDGRGIRFDPDARRQAAIHPDLLLKIRYGRLVWLRIAVTGDLGINGCIIIIVLIRV